MNNGNILKMKSLYKIHLLVIPMPFEKNTPICSRILSIHMHTHIFAPQLKIDEIFTDFNLKCGSKHIQPLRYADRIV